MITHPLHPLLHAPVLAFPDLNNPLIDLVRSVKAACNPINPFALLIVHKSFLHPTAFVHVIHGHDHGQSLSI
jgi:hypothetical protein